MRLCQVHIFLDGIGICGSDWPGVLNYFVTATYTMEVISRAFICRVEDWKARKM